MGDVHLECSTSRELDYGIMDTWDDLVGAIDEIAPTTVEGVNQRVTDLATIVDRSRLLALVWLLWEDAQDDQRLCTFRCYVTTHYSSGTECIDFRVTVTPDSMRHEGGLQSLFGSDNKRQVQLTKTLRLLKGLKHRWSSYGDNMDPQKVRHCPDALREEAVAVRDLVML
ncbi:hypothetical protein Tco_1562642 [Tanacetum coccineum]